MQTACDIPTLELAGSSEHAFKLLCDAHRGTWFSVEGLKWVVAYSSGATAGTPLADMIFIVGMACCMTMIGTRIVSQGLGYQIDAKGARISGNATLVMP